MNQHPPFYRYATHSRACLDRAKTQLAKFDAEQDVEAVFYAALQLRFGIEARVWEYTLAALQAAGREPSSVPDYVASKLLRRLAELDPQSGQASVLSVLGEQGVSMQYTPVSSALAAVHGKLGGYLHHRYFVTNPHWYVGQPLSRDGQRSIGDLRELLVAGVAGLEAATQAALLANPKFTALVSEVLRDSDGSD
jgi:hypothetical protein